jgi:SAM-dependent methyltransferase
MFSDFACPSCRAPLTPVGTDEQRCPGCGVAYRRADGIWRLLGEGRHEAFRGFVERYETVRADEGRRTEDPEHLRALPFQDRARRRSYEWHIRSRSFQALIRNVIQPLERARAEARRPALRIVDLGSGLGWLAYRLALRGHDVAAVDLVTNDFDGLGVHRHYDSVFVSLQAEFDHLPFRDGSADLLVYGASFHYATDYAATLREGLRVLGAGGLVAILDSPFYRDPSSGTAMLRERESALLRKYGSRGDPLETEGFLTSERLSALEGPLDLRWELSQPWYGLRWWLRPWIARLRGRREPAQFKLIVGRRAGRT